MEFKLDFDDLEELQKLLEEVSESVEEFEDIFSNIIDEVKESSSGEALDKITEISDDILPTLKSIATGYQEQADIAKDYIAGVRDINDDKTGVYELDTSEAKGYIKDITNQLEDIEYLDTDTPGLVLFTATYDNNIKEYNSVEATINLEEEYQDDEDTKALIRSKRIEIDNYISNYNYNQNQLESAQDIMTALNKSMSAYIEDLADYKDILEDLKDFEDTFNPGFWDKHGQAIKIVGTIATVVVVGAFLWEAGIVAIAGELLLSAGSAVWAAGDMVLLGISEGAVIDGVTMGAELLVEEGAAWLSEAAIGIELSGTAVMETKIYSILANKYKNYFTTFTKYKFISASRELVIDAKSKEFKELITDIITIPLDSLNLLDNEIFDYNGENMNTFENALQKIDDLERFDIEINNDDTFVGKYI